MVVHGDIVTIKIPLTRKKFERLLKLKERHSMTWEDLLDVAFRLSK